MTVTSMAAGWPLFQLGMYTLAGRVLKPVMREGTSFLSARVAA